MRLIMNYTKKVHKKLLILLFLILLMFPMNLFFLNLDLSKDPTVTTKNYEETEYIENKPKSSQVEMSTFEINGTQIYNNGTFYLFQEDTLFFSLKNPLLTSISNVDVDIDHPVSGAINIALTQDGSFPEWNATYQFSEPGICPSTLTYENTSDSITIDFTLDISNPSPRVVKVWGKDTSYNNQWTEIVEGGVYETYRDTSFDVMVEILNKEGGLDEVKLDSTILTLDDGTNAPLYNYTTSSPIQITLATDDQWKPNENLYEYIINASDSEDFYLFQFYIEVLNKAPLIEQFDLSQTHIPNPSGDTTTVTISANASDFEDDQLYYGSGQKTAKYTDPVLAVENRTGCIQNSPIPDEFSHLDNEDEGEDYDLTFLDSGEGEFLIWMKINDEINLNKIQDFQTKLVLQQNADAISDATLSIYDYTGNDWDLLEDLTGGTGGSKTTYTHTSADVTGAASDYYSPENKTVKLKFYYNDSSDIDMQLDYVDITTTVQRRESFSRVTLYAYAPKDNPGNAEEIEIINFWDEGNGIWSYDYVIENKEQYYGSWTFQIFFMDHGDLNYINQIWGNFSNSGTLRSSSAKYSYNFDPQTDFGFGQVYATKILNLGVSDSTHALNVTSIPSTNSSNGMEPYYDESINVTVDVSGFDNTNGELNYIEYDQRSLVSSIGIQKNTTSGSSSEAIFPNYNVTGSIVNTTTDTSGSNDAYAFKLVKDISQNYAYESAIFSFKLARKFWLDRDNMTSISVEIDNWFNTTNDLGHVYLEFWNYSSSGWIIPSTGSWMDGNLNTVSVNSHFQDVISNSDDIEDIVSANNNFIFRLRIEPNTPTLAQDYELNIDFINISVAFKNYYEAKLYLRSSVNTEVEINLTPLKKDMWTMQYSCVIDFEKLNLHADRFVFAFRFQNGNSTIYYYTFRKEPRIVSKSFQDYYLYEPSEEVAFRNKNYTLNVRNPSILFSEETTLNKFLLVRGKNDLAVNGTLNLYTMEDHPGLVESFEIRKGTNSLSGWRRPGITYDSGTNQWSYSAGVTSYEGGVYFYRLFYRTPYGDEYATNWKEFRINNFQPIEFQFDFDNRENETLSRGDSYSFDFSYLDYDMSESWVQNNIGNLDILSVRVKMKNKSAGDSATWLYPNLVSYNGKSANRHEFSYELIIPDDITTGKYNTSYYNWEFLVNDSNNGIQSQLAFLNYSNTEFIIQNNAPSITNILTDATDDAVYRNNEIKLSFEITDSDENIPNFLSVSYFNISTPSPMVDISVGNNSVDYNAGNDNREYIYFAARDATLGQYNVSIKILDSDGREAYGEISFRVLNNRPVIKKVSWKADEYATNDNNSVYRNIDPDYDIDPINFSIIATDVEDSWLNDNHTEEVYLLLKHEYMDIIRINLTNIEVGSLSNGNNETWFGDYQFNNTVKGEKLFAGEYDIEVYITDSDDDTASNLEKKVNVQNHAPKFHQAMISEFDMEEPKAYYYKTKIKDGDDIEVYVFTSDQEGLDFLKIWYTPLTGLQELGEQQQSKSFDFSDLEMSNESGTPIYKITIEYDSLPEETVKIIMDEIAVFDDDFGFKPTTEYGKSAISITNFGDDEIIEIEGVEITPPDNPLPFIFTIVGIVALIGAVIGGIYYYRKKTSWKRFLD